MLFDPTEEGFLWPEATTITNAYDEEMDVRPSRVGAGFDGETDESARMSMRWYSTDQGEMNENEVAQWICGGPFAWMSILSSIRRVVGDNRRMDLAGLRRQMLEQGVSDAAFGLTIRRLILGGYARLDGEGEQQKITIVKW